MPSLNEIRRGLTHKILSINKPKVKGEENLDLAISMMEKYKEGGVLFPIHNSYSDLLLAAWLLTCNKYFNQKDISVPVVGYIYWLVKPFNDLFTGFNTTSMVTVHMAEDKKNQSREHEGRNSYVNKTRKILKNNGLAYVFPQAQRDKEGIKPPDEKHKAVKGILMMTGNNTILVPIGAWVEGKKPEDLYNGHLYQYNVNVGEPITTGELKKISGNRYNEADKIIYKAISNLVPEDYK
jgi:hypothetical protein